MNYVKQIVEFKREANEKGAAKTSKSLNQRCSHAKTTIAPLKSYAPHLFFMFHIPVYVFIYIYMCIYVYILVFILLYSYTSLKPRIKYEKKQHPTALNQSFNRQSFNIFTGNKIAWNVSGRGAEPG